MEPLSILVSGGAGYIGSHATRRLIDAGHRVVVIDDLSHGHRQAVDPRAAFQQLDIGDRDEVARVLRSHHVEAVLHFAAYIEVGESVEDPGKYYDNNVGKGLAFLGALRAANVRRLIFSSTAAVYGDPVYTPIDEEHPRAPVSPYGRTKDAMEHVLADFARAYGLGYVALRYFNVAGAAPDGAIGEAHEPESHLIPRVLAVAAGQAGHISIFGTDYPTIDGTCVRDYVHVEDLVDAHILALERATPGGGGVAYNLGSERGFTVQQVIDACRRVTGEPVPARGMPRRPGDPPVLVAASDRIRKDLGWSLRHPTLESIVRSAWVWHQRHPHGYGPRA